MRIKMPGTVRTTKKAPDRNIEQDNALGYSMAHLEIEKTLINHIYKSNNNTVVPRVSHGSLKV